MYIVTYLEKNKAKDIIVKDASNPIEQKNKIRKELKIKNIIGVISADKHTNIENLKII